MRELWMLVGILLSMALIAGLSQLSPTGMVVVNFPPQWDYSTSEFSVDDKLEIDLDKAFFDPDGDVLSFSVNPGDGITAGISDNTLIIIAEQPGEVIVTASDGTAQVSQKIKIFG